MHANRYAFLFDYVFCIQDKCFRFLSDDKCFDEELIDNIKDSLHDGLFVSHFFLLIEYPTSSLLFKKDNHDCVSQL